VAGAEHDSSFRVVVENTGKNIAFLTRLRLVKGKEHQEILPVFWQDNYISLLPGEKREVSVSVRKSDLDSAKPMLLVDGFNVASLFVREAAK
jgi:exo-1,4-beta-D-glucosaminidase